MNPPLADCYRGACECGRARVEYRSPRRPERWQARACQCEYCAPCGHRYLSEREARLRIVVPDPRLLYAHRFGTRTADFMHCAGCNNLVFVRSEIAGAQYALAVLATLGEVAAGVESAPVEYGAETVAERLQRRRQRWISEVELLVAR